MNRPSYKLAVEWIALNDGAGDDNAFDARCVAGLTTAVLIADLFGVESEKVGRDIVSFRLAALNIPSNEPDMNAEQAIQRSVERKAAVVLDHTSERETDLRAFKDGGSGEEMTGASLMKFSGMWEGGYEWTVLLRRSGPTPDDTRGD